LPALAYGEFESWYYLVMPYMPYGTLRDRLVKGALPLEITHHLFLQIVDAIKYAHARGILHRDIKASNVLLRDDSFAYLADFGLVKSVEDDYSLTMTGYVIGTPEYMAPELMDHPATQTSDVYALGILLYQMLTGKVPFQATTPMAIILKQLQEQPVPPSTINKNVPRAIELVVLKAIHKDPQQRIQTASALAQAYQDAVDETERTERHPAISAIRANETTEVFMPGPMSVRPVQQPAPHLVAGLLEAFQRLREEFRRKPKAGLAVIVILSLIFFIIVGLALCSITSPSSVQPQSTPIVVPSPTPSPSPTPTLQPPKPQPKPHHHRGD